MKLLYHVLKLIMFFLILLIAENAFAQPGILDLSFGTNGIVRTDIDQMNDYAFATAIQPDGKILMGGWANVDSNNDFCLVRFLSNGDYDSTFGINGIVTTDLNSKSDDNIMALCILSDGKIVVGGKSAGGSSAYNFALARYTNLGVLDSSFGVNGITLTDLNGYNDYGSDLKIQADGKIVMAGYSYDGTMTSMGFCRYLSNGTLDASFDFDGKVNVPIANLYLDGQSLCIQNDGKLIAVGTTKSPGNNYDHFITRLNSNGSLDSSYGTNGIVIHDICYTDYANDAILQQDGKLVVAGTSIDTVITLYGRAFSAARFLTDGSIDTTFGGDGQVISKISMMGDQAFGLVETTNGKLVLAGHSADGVGDFRLALVSYQHDGTIDSNFGTNGIVMTNMASEHEFAEDIAVQPDGKIVTTGFFKDGASFNMFVARYLGESPLQTNSIKPTKRFVVVPNPLINSSTIYFPQEVKKAILNLYDISGRYIESYKNIEGDHFMLNRKNLPSGWYIIEVLSEGMIARERILFQ